MSLTRIFRSLMLVTCMAAADAACAQVDWTSPLGIELGETSCRQMQRQKRQTWDLWTRYVSEVTGGQAFYPEKAVVDTLPGLRRMAIVCDQERGKVAAIYLMLPRALIKEAADGFTYRFATVKTSLVDPHRGGGLWRDETDYVSIEYDENNRDTFDLMFTTEAFHRLVEERASRSPRARDWTEAPH